MNVALSFIRNRLAVHSPTVLEIPFDQVRVRGAVALCLREVGEDTEILMIQRAEFEGDVWSGDIAFPGGRIDSAEEPPRVAAERETLEEVGIDLSSAEYLGRIDDVTGSSHEVLVSAFVFAVGEGQQVELNHEVSAIRWMAMSEIGDPCRQLMHEFEFRGDKVLLPALRVFDDDQVALLWGLTYQFLRLFTELLDRPIPGMPWRENS
jgi:8-oxo-dGTP pyrophosphatase MutT (NUDIX family)